MPSEREGAGNGQSWFKQSVQETEAGESQSPPYLIGTAQARQEAIGQIYERVDSKDPPPCNIASEAIKAYYSGVEARTVKTWACQVLCMISEYHTACVTRGLPVTSPILPGVIKDKLPPLTGYALPEDRSGVTDVWVRDHQARTLRVAVWLHRLDMALSEEPAASGSLVRAQHSLGRMLAYFLAPGTAWGLQFEDVVDQVLWENRKQNERRCNESSSSLRKCHSRRTKLRDKFDAVSKTMEVITDGRSHREMEQRLRAPSPSSRTSLRIVGWWRRSSARLRKTRPARRRRRPPTSRWSMRKNAVIQSPLAPVWRPIPRTSLRWSRVKIPSPQRRKQSSWMKHPNQRIRQLDLAAPGVRPPWSQEGWPSYVSHPRATLGPRRMRPHNRSLPFSDIP